MSRFAYSTVHGSEIPSKCWYRAVLSIAHLLFKREAREYRLPTEKSDEPNKRKEDGNRKGCKSSDAH
jgi:hypothetical protein